MVDLKKTKEGLKRKAEAGKFELLFIILIVIAAMAAVIGLFLLKWAIELWLWKTVVMAVFTSAPALTFWQMAGIDIIASCLFGGTRVVKTESNKK